MAGADGGHGGIGFEVGTMSGPPVDPQLLERLDDLTAALESAAKALEQLANPPVLATRYVAGPILPPNDFAGLETHGKQEWEGGAKAR